MRCYSHMHTIAAVLEQVISLVGWPEACKLFLLLLLLQLYLEMPTPLNGKWLSSTVQQLRQTLPMQTAYKTCIPALIHSSDTQHSAT